MPSSPCEIKEKEGSNTEKSNIGNSCPFSSRNPLQRSHEYETEGEQRQGAIDDGSERDGRRDFEQGRPLLEG